MGVEMARALGDIVVERDKQRRVLGYGNDRDDQYTVGQLASAAAMYAYASTFLDAKRDYLRTARTDQDGSTITINLLRHLWPNNWKPPTWHDRRHQLVKAGAMIVAEIERIDRLAEKGLDANMRPLQPWREPE